MSHHTDAARPAIARRWRGVTRREDADAYLAYLQRTGLTDYHATPGNLGIVVERTFEGAHAVFVLTTYWESEDAIRRFAGDDITVARYYPEDDVFLLEKPPHVTHTDVLYLRGPREPREPRE